MSENKQRNFVIQSTRTTLIYYSVKLLRVSERRSVALTSNPNCQPLCFFSLINVFSFLSFFFCYLNYQVSSMCQNSSSFHHAEQQVPTCCFPWSRCPCVSGERIHHGSAWRLSTYNICFKKLRCVFLLFLSLWPRLSGGHTDRLNRHHVLVISCHVIPSQAIMKLLESRDVHYNGCRG